jgi:LPPG:FO 2-phospho-L-lactate transferase
VEVSIAKAIPGILPGVRVTLLSGGIGGARFALGVRDVVGTGRATVVGNVGDDLEHWGLRVSPDLDTVLYTLAGRVGELGWGVRNDSRRAMTVVGELGGPDWFILGDADVGLHLVRTERLARGEPLSSIIADVARRWRIGVDLVPATDDNLRTIVSTDDGDRSFQDWFVRLRGAPAVRSLRFEGDAGARPAPGVLATIAGADRVLIAPSNPFLSIDPILAVPGIRDALVARRESVVAVSPIIAGNAVKGPLGEMLDALGHERSALGVARYLAAVCGAFVVDEADAHLAPAIAALGVRPVVASTLMSDPAARAALAAAAIEGR